MKKHLLCSLALSLCLNGFSQVINSVDVYCDRSNYSGLCPVRLNFFAVIHYSGQGTIKYSWQRNDGASGSVQLFELSGSGHDTLRTNWTLGADGFTYAGWQKIKITYPITFESGTASFSISCSSAKSSNPNSNAPIPPITVNRPQATVHVKEKLHSLAEWNPGFEFNLAGWNTQGSAFSNQPITGNTVITNRALPAMQYNHGGIGGDYWKEMPYAIGYKGNNWVGSFEKGNGNMATGTLTSGEWTIKERYLHFLLGGDKDLANLYVELQVKKTDYEQAWGAGKKGFFGDTQDGFTRVDRKTALLNNDDLFRYFFDFDALLNHQYLNKRIRICITDNSSNGHINTDDFVFAANLDNLLRFNRSGFNLLADADKPVWGFGDTHAHWVNHVGLNGLFHGTPGYSYLTSDVRRDIPPCDGFNHRLPFITASLLISQTEKAAFNRLPERLTDPGNAACAALLGASIRPITLMSGASAGILSGANASAASLDPLITNMLIDNAANPGFQACGYAFTKDVLGKHYNNNVPEGRTDVNNYVDFPRWNSFVHQGMHISWVRRSYEGGQRLMVVPIGTAKSWEFLTVAEGRMATAKENIEKGVEELKRIVAANNDWMEIALTPVMARQIILSNKMAIVIGIEQAETGNFFSSVQDEINWLQQLGIRHVFPIHNIDNNLGGAAVFNSKINSYNDLVRRSSNNGPIVALKVKEGNVENETRTNFKLEPAFMRQNFRLVPIIGFGNIPFFHFVDVNAEYHYNDFAAHKNVQGLTGKGRQYITELMRRGMIIEIDHMSDASQDEAVMLLKSQQYPMISGHCNLRDLRRESTETNKEEKLKTEFTIYNSRADDIIRSGGMFGIMNAQNDIAAAAGCPVKNNASGSSASFAQAYWYLFKKTKGASGICFGSDFNGFAPQTAPRFGVDADYFLEDDKLRNTRCDGSRDEDKLRRCNAFKQQNGVRYDAPVKTYHYHRFLKPPFLTAEERDIWEAIAIAKSGTTPSQAWQPGGGLSAERTGLQQDKIHNLAEGFRLRREGNYLQVLDCPEYVLKGDCPAERKAAFMAVHGENSIPATLRNERTDILYKVIKPVYQLWMQFEEGPNEPLRRSYAYNGGRDFDFNLDGLAHYGMYPDFIQDLKNNGLKPEFLVPIFKGAEQYIRMWEKATAER